MQNSASLEQAQSGVLSTNKVLRQTYALLSMTLLFSAAMALLSIFIAVPHGIAMGASIVAIALLMFVLPRYENSASGIGLVFIATGLLGFGLGPMLSHYLSYPNGPVTIATALVGTGGIFLALSAYVLTTKKDFSFMGGFLFVGLIAVFGAAILNIFMQIPVLSSVISAALILVMSGFILFDTSRIIHGGENNYIRATVSLYINIFNIFTSLLHLFGIMGDE